MDDNKKLFEGLLKADGIDPAGISEAERTAFRQMLESEQKIAKRLSWVSVGAMWIFALAMIGLCLYEKILETLRIPFIAACIGVMAVMCYVFIVRFPRHNRKLMESNRKISKLYYLVNGKHRGFPLVSRKNGKRIIHWLGILRVIAIVWVVMSLSAAGIWYLLCQGWIFSSTVRTTNHILYCTAVSLSFVIYGLRSGLKAPLDELAEIKAKVRQSKPSIAWPDIWRIIMKHKLTKLAAAAVIIVAVMLGLNIIGGPDMASVALADVAKSIEQVKNCVFKKTTTMSSEGNGTNSFDSLVYYTEAAVREDLYDDQKITHHVYVTFTEGILVGVDHKTKVFKKMDLADEDLEKMSPVSPKNIVNLILGKGKYKELGRKTVDGVLSEGFEFSDKRAMLSMDKDKIENVATRLWVDVNTNLPVRVEVDCVLINDSKANVVMRDPKWDVELAPDFFEPNIPADYIKPEQRGLIGINLENWPTLEIVSGMAAEKAGVRNGDVALEVDGNSISHAQSSGEALNLLLGKAGEKVVLTVKRGEQILTFEIVRAPLPK